MTDTSRRQQILNLLADGSRSAAALASALNVPTASIRRNVSELRDRQYDIRYENKSYTYYASPVQANA